jgi:hypothetical protein
MIGDKDERWQDKTTGSYYHMHCSPGYTSIPPTTHPDPSTPASTQHAFGGGVEWNEGALLGAAPPPPTSAIDGLMPSPNQRTRCNVSHRTGDGGEATGGSGSDSDSSNSSESSGSECDREEVTAAVYVDGKHVVGAANVRNGYATFETKVREDRAAREANAQAHRKLTYAEEQQQRTDAELLQQAEEAAANPNPTYANSVSV